MDKIWDRKSFEVGGHWPLWWGCKNRMTTQNRQKSNAKKIIRATSQTSEYAFHIMGSKCTPYIGYGFIFDKLRIESKHDILTFLTIN